MPDPPDVTVDQSDVSRLLTDYDKANNAVIAATSTGHRAHLWRTVDMGPVLAADIYATRHARLSGGKDASPWFHGKGTALSPRVSRYPAWTVITSTHDRRAKSRDVRVELWLRQSPTVPWKLVADGRGAASDIVRARATPQQASRSAKEEATRAFASLWAYLTSEGPRPFDVGPTAAHMRKSLDTVRGNPAIDRLVVEAARAWGSSDRYVVPVAGGHLAVDWRKLSATMHSPTMSWRGVDPTPRSHGPGWGRQSKEVTAFIFLPTRGMPRVVAFGSNNVVPAPTD